jgi:hypothetical protein
MRKKLRLLVKCSCGCGTDLINVDVKGRNRKFISGHNSFAKIIWYICKECGNKFRKKSYGQKYCDVKCMTRAYQYKIDECKVIKLYTEDKISTRKIGKILNVGYSVIINVLKRNNIVIEKPDGERSGGWLGGISFIEYTKDFNEILREQIRDRDGRKCQLCGVPERECINKLAVHHKDYRKHNCKPINLISLCHNCHSKTNTNRKYWICYFKNKKEKVNDNAFAL